MQLLNPSLGLLFTLYTHSEPSDYSPCSGRLSRFSFFDCEGVIALVTTLYIPLVDPQPITADIEGVDASGHTTWRLGPGVPSGTLTPNGAPFPSGTPPTVYTTALPPPCETQPFLTHPRTTQRRSSRARQTCTSSRSTRRKVPPRRLTAGWAARRTRPSRYARSSTRTRPSAGS